MMLKVLDYNESGNSATVQLNSAISKVPAYTFDDRLVVTGLAVRFPNGTRAWHGHALLAKESHRVIGIFSDGHHRPLKENESLNVIGFYSKVDEAVRGKHRGTGLAMQRRKAAK